VRSAGTGTTLSNPRVGERGRIHPLMASKEETTAGGAAGAADNDRGGGANASGQASSSSSSNAAASRGAHVKLKLTKELALAAHDGLLDFDAKGAIGGMGTKLPTDAGLRGVPPKQQGGNNASGGGGTAGGGTGGGGSASEEAAWQRGVVGASQLTEVDLAGDDSYEGFDRIGAAVTGAVGSATRDVAASADAAMGPVDAFGAAVAGAFDVTSTAARRDVERGLNRGADAVRASARRWGWLRCITSLPGGATRLGLRVPYWLTPNVNVCF
jgi:hypothetical protein